MCHPCLPVHDYGTIAKHKSLLSFLRDAFATHTTPQLFPSIIYTIKQEQKYKYKYKHKHIYKYKDKYKYGTIAKHNSLLSFLRDAFETHTTPQLFPSIKQEQKCKYNQKYKYDISA